MDEIAAKYKIVLYKNFLFYHEFAIDSQRLSLSSGVWIEPPRWSVCTSNCLYFGSKRCSVFIAGFCCLVVTFQLQVFSCFPYGLFLTLFRTHCHGNWSWILNPRSFRSEILIQILSKEHTLIMSFSSRMTSIDNFHFPLCMHLGWRHGPLSSATTHIIVHLHLLEHTTGYLSKIFFPEYCNTTKLREGFPQPPSPLIRQRGVTLLVLRVRTFIPVSPGRFLVGHLHWLL